MGQVQILAILLFLLLIPTTAIIAQNSTTNMSSGEITGEMIDSPATDETPESPLNEPESNQIQDNETQGTEPEINVTEPENETIEVPPSNQTNETEPTENVTIPDERNQTVNETDTNQTTINETETNETEPEEPVIPEINETVNETLNETINETINETGEAKPILDVGIISSDRVARGETLEISAYARNIGSASANDVRIEWILPDVFDISTGSGSVNCQEVAPETSCWNNITATVPLSSHLGLSDIKVRVVYSE